MKLTLFAYRQWWCPKSARQFMYCTVVQEVHSGCQVNVQALGKTSRLLSGRSVKKHSLDLTVSCYMNWQVNGGTFGERYDSYYSTQTNGCLHSSGNCHQGLSLLATSSPAAWKLPRGQTELRHSQGIDAAVQVLIRMHWLSSVKMSLPI